MESKKAALLLNGDYKDECFYKDILKTYDLIVCADGAGNFLYKMEILPDILLGDLDSIKEDALEYFRSNKVIIETFPPEKNYTDSQLGALKIKKLGYNSIDILGGFGSRVDHSLGNIGLIYWGYKENMEISLIDENNNLQGLKIGETIIKPRDNSVFSILAIFEDLEGLSIEYAKYLLDDYNLKKGIPRGISNEFLDTDVKLTLKKGFGLLCISNKI